MKKIRKWFKKYFNIIIGKGKPSRKLVHAAEGSITILLLVIMLPTLVFSFSVLDICKIFLARDAIASATDLTLRSALTSYDDVLKDMYGILACSKSDDDLKKNMANYYMATLSSSGIKAEDDGATLNFIKSIFETSIDEDMNNNNNFLKVFPGGEIDGTNYDAIFIKGVPESAASNPDVLRRQIVEYMKYRGPVIMAAGMFDKINAFKDLPNQANVVDKQIAYEKTVSDVGNKVIKAYTLLKVYDYNNKLLMGQSASLDDLFAINEKEDIIDANKYAYVQDFGFDALINNKYMTGGGSDPDYAIKCCVIELETSAAYVSAIQEYIPYLRSHNGNIELISLSVEKDKDEDYYRSKMEEAYTELTESTDPDVKKIYDWVDKKEVANKLKALGQDIYSAFGEGNYSLPSDSYLLLNNFAALFKFEKGQEPGEPAFLKICRRFMQYYGKLKSDNVELDSKYTELHNKITLAENAIKQYVEDFYDMAEGEFNMGSEDLNMLYDAMSKQSGIIDKLLGKDAGLEKIYEDFQKATNDAKNYKDAIDKVETETQKNSNLAQYESEAQDFAVLKHDDVEKMKTVLSEQQKIYKEAMRSIESIAYFYNVDKNNFIIKKGSSGNEHRKSTKFTDYISKSNASNIGLIGTIMSIRNTNAEVYNGDPIMTYSKYDKSVVGSYTNWNEFFPKVTDNDKNPFYKKLEELSKPKSDKGNTDEGKELKKTVTEKVATGEDGQPKTSDGDGNGENSSNGTDSSPYNTDFNPSEIKKFSDYYSDTKTQDGDDNTLSTVNSGTNDDKNMAKNTQSLIKSLQTYLKDLGKNLGESVLVTEYINQQFSCYTTNMDGKGNRDTNATMLTGYKFCKDDKTPNVEWYGAEQEYILYGFDTPEANIAAASATIYAIRFVLNLIYSFTDTEITSFTTSVATAAGGIFPLSIPLIKTALHIGLSLAESAYDLMKLKQGAEVPFYKTSNTWMCKGTNIVRDIAADALETAGSKVIDATEENINKLVDKGYESLSDLKKEKKEEIDKLLEDEKEKLRSQIKTDILLPLELAIQQCIINFGNSTDIRSKLNETLDKTCGNIEEQLGLNADFGEDNILKTTEKEVMTFVKGQLKTYADNIANHIGDYIDAATGVKVSDFSNAAEGYLGAFSKKIEDLFSGAIDEIFNAVKGVEDKISDKLDEALEQLCEQTKKGIKIGADAARDAISSVSNKIRGQGHLNTEIVGKGEKTSAVSMVSMSYQDYLTIFMMISVATGDVNQLERMSQLITANVRKVSKNTDYDLNKAHTLFKAESAASVRTVFFGAVYEDGKFDLSNNPGKYSFRYSSYLGY